MPKEYIFEFPGTKEEFLNNLNRFEHYESYSGNKLYYRSPKYMFKADAIVT